MRVTNTMLIKDMLWNANKNLNAMSQKQTDMSTGERIHKPSDDPVGITRVIKYRTDIRESQQYQKNIDDALGWLEMSESSLMNIKEILQRMRELTVKAANGTNTPADRDKIKSEIVELRKEILVSGNATNAGKYIFSGYDTDEKLFNDDGTYNIDITSERAAQKATIGYEVTVGEVMQVGVHPIDIFGSVAGSNFFDGLIANDSINTQKATRGEFKATVDVNRDFSSDTLSVDVDGTSYTVPGAVMATLNNSYNNPMTKDKLISALGQATDGTNDLSAVADIYFDNNNQLMITSKTYGSGSSVTNNITSAGFSSMTPASGATASGTDGLGGTITGAGNVTDAAVAAETGIHEFVIQVDGERRNLSIDFSTLNTAADLQAAMQTQVDPTNTSITVSVADGAPISFTKTGTNDGQAHTMSVDFIATNQSEMVADIDTLITGLETDDNALLEASLDNMDKHLDRVLTVLGEIGGKNNRVDFIKSRVEDNEITFTDLLSKIQDTDVAESIMYFKNLENVYRASLSVGSKVIQPSLVDFIR